MNNASPPLFSCGQNCTFEYCGDGVISPPEECDGPSLPASAPANAVCDSNRCRLIIPQYTAAPRYTASPPPPIVTGTPTFTVVVNPLYNSPTPTPSPNNCVWIAAWAHKSTMKELGNKTDASGLEAYIASRADSSTWTSVPSCFADRFAGVCGIQTAPFKLAGAVEFGMCEGQKPGKPSNMNRNFFTPDVLADFLGVTYSQTQGPTAADQGSVLNWYDYESKSLNNPDPIMWYMDANCHEEATATLIGDLRSQGPALS